MFSISQMTSSFKVPDVTSYSLSESFRVSLRITKPPSVYAAKRSELLNACVHRNVDARGRLDLGKIMEKI